MDTQLPVLPINMYDPTRDYKLHKDEYDTSIHKVLDKGNFIMGEQVTELEKQLAAYVGAKHCISCANGTDAMYVALMALGVGSSPDDEVITVPHTWISTSEVIALTHAKPVFVDIEQTTFNMDVSKLEEAITSRTKAILPVSLYGHLPDYRAIKEIANRYGIPVIEDGAQSFGGERDGYKSCSCTHTTFSTTSFFPSKPLGCYGDGGAIFTNDDELAKKAKAIKSHGGLERFKHKYVGVNSRLDTLQASVLLVKMKYLDECLINRDRVAQYYNTSLAEVSQLVKPVVEDGCKHVWAQYSLLTESKEVRESLLNYLKDRKINCSVFYPSALHTQECFSYLGYAKGSFPITEETCDKIINLPCYAELTLDEQNYIINVVKEFYTK